MIVLALGHGPVSFILFRNKLMGLSAGSRLHKSDSEARITLATYAQGQPGLGPCLGCRSRTYSRSRRCLHWRACFGLYAGEIGYKA